MNSQTPQKYSVQELLDSYQNIEQKYTNSLNECHKQYSQDDARMLFLANLVQLLRASRFSLISYLACKQDRDKIVSFGIKEIPTELWISFEPNYTNYAQTSLFISLYIQIEGFMRSVAKAVNETNLNNLSNGNQTETLFEQLIAYTSNNQEYKNLLKLLTYLRNTIHNVGFQSKPTTKITVQGVEYEFRQGENTEWFNFSTLLGFIDFLHEAMNSIIKDNKVSNIPYIRHYISDTVS